ncbi:unnamed protein product [Symbiodinium microadriaticum]|nr:unnamed protein product [Symbiodinium microadriaticum]
MEDSLMAGSKDSQLSPLASSSRRNNAWHDVLEICKKGFANKMSSMSHEILGEVRLEVDQSATALRKDVAGMLEQRERTANDKLSRLDEKMDKVVDWAKCGYVDFSKFDFTPVLDEIRSSEMLHAESSRMLSQRLDESLVLISNTLEKLSSQSEEKDSKLEKLRDRVQASEEILVQVSETLQSSSKDLAEKVGQFQEQAGTKNQEFASELGFVADRLRKPLPIDDKALLEQVQKLTEAQAADTNTMLGEIGKIQQAMNLDFVKTVQGNGEDWTTSFPAVAVAMDPTMHSMSPEMLGLKGGKGSPEKPEKKRVRVREFFSQTDTVETQIVGVQTDPKMMDVKKKVVLRPSKTAKASKMQKDITASRTRGFTDADALKKKARQALMKPPYNVMDYYRETGIFQRIARSTAFDWLSLFMVILNAGWIAVDADLNTAAVITNASPPFILVENLFCTYFFAEVFIRFMAFAEKWRCLRDGWFVFDSLLVFTMVIETWIMPIIVLGFNLDLANALDLSTLRMFRMVKLLRLSRMAKLLRAVPELTIIMKGIRLATRSVVVFFALWMMIIYVFALVLRQLTEGQSVGSQYFANVPQSVNNLLLYGILPEQREIVTTLGNAGAWMWPLILCFFLLCSITIMYMLVGVLVDVIRVISTTEKEGLTVAYLASELRDKMDALGYNSEEPLTQFEFQKLLLEPEIAVILSGEGVDVIALVDSLDMIYEDLSKNGKDGLDFAAALELLLNMRGGNAATVKDVKEQLRLTKSLVKSTQWTLMEKMTAEFANVLAQLRELREEALQRDGREAEEDVEFEEVAESLMPKSVRELPDSPVSHARWSTTSEGKDLGQNGAKLPDAEFHDQERAGAPPGALQAAGDRRQIDVLARCLRLAPPLLPVLPRLLAKLVGPLAWDEAPRTPRALRETTVDFGERLSQPKQTVKVVNPLSATRPRLSTTTRILSSSADSTPSFSLATVHFERPASSPASGSNVSASAEKKPSSAPVRVVSLERLKALAEPKRRRSKFIRAKSFVGPIAVTKSKSPKPRLPAQTETDARRPTSRRERRGDPGSEARESREPKDAELPETKPPAPNRPTEEGDSLEDCALQSTKNHEATEVHGNSVTFSKTEKSERSFDASPAKLGGRLGEIRICVLGGIANERSEYEFEEVSPASHGKSAPSLAVCTVGMSARFIATTRSDVEETSKHGLEDVSPTSNSRTVQSPEHGKVREWLSFVVLALKLTCEVHQSFDIASHARTAELPDKSYNTSFVPEEESDAQEPQRVGILRGYNIWKCLILDLLMPRLGIVSWREETGVHCCAFWNAFSVTSRSHVYEIRQIRQLFHVAMGHSLLVASMAFALLGSCWMMVVLAWQYPWLLHLLFFVASTLSFFALAAACLLLYFIQMAYESDDGALQLLPQTVGKLLNDSPFEIVEKLSRAIMRPLYDWIRVLLLVNLELDEDTRKEILEEMSPEFRRRVFQYSVGQLLPKRLQRFVLGRNYNQARTPENMQDLFEATNAPQNYKGEIRVRGKSLSRSQSLNDLLAFLKTVDNSQASLKQSSVIEKILASKVADGAIWTMSQGAVHQYESHLSGRVRTFLENVSKKPENRLLRVPWAVVNWELTAARTVLRTMVSLFREAEEEPETCKKDT